MLHIFYKNTYMDIQPGYWIKRKISSEYGLTANKYYQITRYSENILTVLNDNKISFKSHMRSHGYKWCYNSILPFNPTKLKNLIY